MHEDCVCVCAELHSSHSSPHLRTYLSRGVNESLCVALIPI